MDVSTKTWVVSALSAAEMVSFTIPAVGPVVAAGEAVAQFLIEMFWPSSGSAPSPLQQALDKANQDLGSQLNIDIANFDDLLAWMQNMEPTNINSTDPIMHQQVYDTLYGAIEPGDSSKISSQLTNMELQMLKQDVAWREQFLILNAYLTGVGVELLCLAQLIFMEAMIGQVSNALLSGYIGELNAATTERTGKLDQAINSTNTNLMVQLKGYDQGGWAWLGRGVLSVPLEAACYETCKDKVIFDGHTPFEDCPEYTDAVVKLNQAVTTSEGWKSQAAAWVAAQAAIQQ